MRNKNARTVAEIHGLCTLINSLETATTATTLAATHVGWDWGGVLNATDLDASAGEGTESGLATWSWGGLTLATGSADLDVHGTDAELLQGEHGG